MPKIQACSLQPQQTSLGHLKTIKQLSEWTPENAKLFYHLS
jgi:hypothetical protein